MKNDIFKIDFDKGKGIINSLILVNDVKQANFISNLGYGLFQIGPYIRYGIPFINDVKQWRTMLDYYELDSFVEI